MERLRDSLHFIDQDEDEEDEDEDEAPTKKSNHVVFVDSQEEGIVHACVCVCASLYTHSSFFLAKQFDPVKHLDTVPELVNRKFNRPRIETLKKKPILAPENATSLKVNKSIAPACYSFDLMLNDSRNGRRNERQNTRNSQPVIRGKRI